MLHESIRVRELPVDAKWKAVSEGETMLVHIVMPKVEEEPAAGAAEGAAAGSAAVPEVMKKGKADEKEDEKKK